MIHAGELRIPPPLMLAASVAATALGVPAVQLTMLNTTSMTTSA